MDRMCAILEVMTEWVSGQDAPPLIYAALSRTRSRNSPYPYIGAMYAAEGGFEWIECGGVRTALPRNHMRVVWTHKGACSSEPLPGTELWSCAFDVSGVKVFDRFIRGPVLEAIPVSDPGRLCYAYQSVATQFRMKRMTSRIRLKAALLNWLAALLDEAYGRQSDGGGPLPLPVERALDFVHRRFGDPGLSLDGIAQASGLSRHHFGRVFLGTMNTSPVAYLRQVRLEHARNLLKDTSLRVSEVAREAGFSDPLHFSRVFRRFAGESPRKYRSS